MAKMMVWPGSAKWYKSAISWFKANTARVSWYWVSKPSSWVNTVKVSTTQSQKKIPTKIKTLNPNRPFYGWYAGMKNKPTKASMSSVRWKYSASSWRK